MGMGALATSSISYAEDMVVAAEEMIEAVDAATEVAAEEAAPVEAAMESIATVEAAAEEAPIVVAEAATEEAAPAAEAPVVETVDKGDTAWMMVATLLVILMTVPGLALFYGGLVRSKNMLSILMQVLVVFSVISVAWAVYGYSLAFGSGEGLIIGDLGKVFLKGVSMDSLAATFTDGVMIPELIFIAFQCTFAGITCALIVGSFAERMKFGAVIHGLGYWWLLIRRRCFRLCWWYCCTYQRSDRWFSWCLHGRQTYWLR